MDKIMAKTQTERTHILELLKKGLIDRAMARKLLVAVLCLSLLEKSNNAA